ncbi:hypothetical protein TNCV_2529071 [Trichonephila clavipes]|nr:hypothetical protein TNCV_2529071 [Trichonephila clavipes]
MEVGVIKSSVSRILRTFHDSGTFSPKRSGRGQGSQVLSSLLAHGSKSKSVAKSPRVAEQCNLNIQSKEKKKKEKENMGASVKLLQERQAQTLERIY